MEILQCSVDHDDESEFRVIVDGDAVKHITIDNGVYNPDDMCFAPAIESLTPTPLPGDWNQGRVSKEDDGSPHWRKRDINKHNLLVREGKMGLIEFDGAKKCDDEAYLAR
ncbi:Iron-sulfur clusters transporter atm1, mitochondrial [Sphaceloma murrayae]|uniref:Iron-sulfur clusters transporter atm1, mitochondrial n=1 Tax=Sphaceloma murrayae TaxID=2082308 RepID=A0A2K1QUX2_9PEZI|nr:Iron-sulfur clusters transporter atm1, mitochondrial [Sphaceloma murrayae]